MGRSKGLAKDRPGTETGTNTLGRLAPALGALVQFTPDLFVRTLLALALLALPLILTALPCTAGPGPALTDLWDVPVDLAGICRGQATLLLICDPGMATCREAAVYFDSKAGMITDEEVRPAIVLIGNPPAIREAVLDLDIGIPVFIDPDGSVFGSILTQRILPALALLAADGTVIEAVYGGGDSLDGNIRTLVEIDAGTGEDGGFNWWLLAVPAAAALAVLAFVLD